MVGYNNCGGFAFLKIFQNDGGATLGSWNDSL